MKRKILSGFLSSKSTYYIFTFIYSLWFFLLKKKSPLVFSFFFCKKKPFCNFIVGPTEPQGGFSESKDPQRVSEPLSQGTAGL